MAKLVLALPLQIGPLLQLHSSGHKPGVTLSSLEPYTDGWFATRLPGVRFLFTNVRAGGCATPQCGLGNLHHILQSFSSCASLAYPSSPPVRASSRRNSHQRLVVYFPASRSRHAGVLPASASPRPSPGKACACQSCNRTVALQPAGFQRFHIRPKSRRIMYLLIR